MIKEAALITISCVLFVQMGLSEAIQEKLNFKSLIASCPKCLSFWSVLAFSLVNGYGLIPSLAASFIGAYAALWLSLIVDGLAVLYNSIYESITPKTDAAQKTGKVVHAKAGRSDAVS